MVRWRRVVAATTADSPGVGRMRKSSMMATVGRAAKGGKTVVGSIRKTAGVTGKADGRMHTPVLPRLLAPAGVQNLLMWSSRLQRASSSQMRMKSYARM